MRDGDRAAKACNHVFIGNKGASGRATRTQDERPVRFVAVGDVLRDRGGPRKAGKGARWAFIGRFRLAAEVTGKVTLLLKTGCSWEGEDFVGFQSAHGAID